ncbi:hypothetical protein IscW_ISCW002203 [Ixodes scapularis]|uniref:Peptidase M13 C-terminal domain-containing protein n=1 Tax=Ixodes scapularis TaxID=6945 RepID=B7PBQ2_IXOSC|nr:hypothetical protein IscW_ISCW002203 [Ixodes scapularis]|eukprot:XP_002408747.1 hypothetical protein IscW_ISCW002203 [Ixodes scapularis]
MTEESIMGVAIPFADASFMIDVQKVDRLFRIWINQVPSSYRTPVIGVFDAIANKTPNIDKATWKASINKYLLTPFDENLSLINLHNMWGLLIMSNLKKEFEANTKPVYHWLTMMVHSYLFSASSFEYVLLSRSPTSKCAATSGRWRHPCQDLYSYSCGNWDVFKKNDEDAYDRLERIVMETGRNWIMQTPVSSGQHRSRDKVMAAYKLCHEVYLGRKENMNDARQYLSRLGLRYYNDSFPVTGIVEFMVKLTMRHGIHTLLAIQPKYDLGNLGDSGNTTRLTISGQSLIVDNWIVDMTEESIMGVAIPFADASFMIDVQKVDRLFRIWINQVPSSYRTPVIGVFDAIANKTPNIDKATWKASINKYLLTPFDENLSLINLHNMWGLLIMSNLKKEFEANTKPVYHWLTMMVHSYLFSASSFEYVLLSRSPTSKCASYIRQVAPFALQALFAHKHVSTDDVALAKRIHRKFVSLSSRVFPWLGGDKSAQERFRNVRVILGIPDILYNPLTMDRHYSYLPKFDEPVVLSILLAFEAKAKHDMLNYQMGMFTSGVLANRYRFKPLREDGVAENFFLGATPLYVPYFSVFFIPPVLLSTTFFAGSSSVSQWASIGRLIARGMVHPFTVANVEKSDVGLLQYWPYDFYSEYALRIACMRNLYDNLIPSRGTRVYADVARDENMADIGGLELLLEGIKNDSCYVPTNPSRIPGLNQQKLLFVSYCMSFCGSRASIDSYVPSKIPRRDHRCNVVHELSIFYDTSASIMSLDHARVAKAYQQEITPCRRVDI